jgi:hypothetical protein
MMVTHSGPYGLHTLIDDHEEFPGVTCQYTPTEELKTIKIRPPVVWADDDSHGTDVQTVRWRATILGTIDDTKELVVVKVTDWRSAEATDSRAARWRGRTVTVDGSDHPFWVARIRIEWVQPSGPPAFAIHSVAYHKMPGATAGYCSSA